MVSNEILRDDTISLKAKGLFSLIQSYISLENFILYKGFLLSRCKEGKKAFDTAWKELKDAGYLVQYQMQDPETKQFYWEYELIDSIQEKPCTQKRDMELNSHTPKRDVMAQGIYGERDTMGFGGINNIIKNNTNLNNIISNHINRTEVIRQIGYDENTIDEFVENIVALMLDIFNTPDDALIRVNQSNQPAKVVKERFRQIRYKHIEYIRLVFSDFNGEISSFRNYMVTTLYNSVTTCDLYFNQRVNRDLYGKGEKEWKQAK